MNMVVLLVPPRHIVETFDGIRCPSPTRSAQEFQGHQADAGPGDPSHALVVVAMACTNERKQKGHAVMKIKDKANNEMISFGFVACSLCIIFSNIMKNAWDFFSIFERSTKTTGRSVERST